VSTKPGQVQVPDRLPAVAARLRPAGERWEAVPAEARRSRGPRQARAAAAEGPDAPQGRRWQRLAL